MSADNADYERQAAARRKAERPHAQGSAMDAPLLGHADQRSDETSVSEAAAAQQPQSAATTVETTAAAGSAAQTQRAQSTTHTQTLQSEPGTDVSLMNWAKGTAAGFMAIVIPLSLGLIDGVSTDAKNWYMVFAPALCLAVVQLIICSKLAPLVGGNMIVERSMNIDIKEAMRNNMTTQGLISALMLTIVVTMILIDVPGGDPDSLLAQWYTCFVAISLMWAIIATMITVMLLLYIEPLDREDAFINVQAHLMYFGEPFTMCAAAFLNILAAVTVYVFATYGKATGTICTICIFYTAMRVVVIFCYMSKWKNKQLSTDEREKRDKWALRYATTGEGRVFDMAALETNGVSKPITDDLES